MIDIEELKLKQANFESSKKEFNKEIIELEKLRKQFLRKFKLEELRDLPIDEYIVGKRNEDSFCYWLETKLMNLGKIKGGTTADKKFGIYFNKGENKYIWLTKKYGDTQEIAYKSILEEIIDLIEKGCKKDYEGIKQNKISPMFKGKILSTYYPESFLNIFSKNHLEYFLDIFGIEVNKDESEVDLRVKLLEIKNSDDVMKSWSNYEYAKFLYTEFGRPVNDTIKLIKKEQEDEVAKEIKNLNTSEKTNFLNDEIKKITSENLAPIEEKTSTNYFIKRNFRLYQLLKEKYNYKCQVCNFTFKKKDGSYYCEVCHIDPLASSRLDNEDNILVLCPNCHKKLDLGNEEVRSEILKIKNNNH